MCVLATLKSLSSSCCFLLHFLFLLLVGSLMEAFSVVSLLVPWESNVSNQKMSIWASSSNSSLPESHKENHQECTHMYLWLFNTHKHTSVWTCVQYVRSCIHVSFQSQSLLKWKLPQLEMRGSSCWQIKPHVFRSSNSCASGQRMSLFQYPSDDSCHNEAWIWRIHFSVAVSWALGRLYSSEQ